ncbi:MAG: sigma 54-interacting transcriptional regulator [Candidatus Glassbacteria bacterium]|nr:sigma 54-interacting transcriptional regulator [Candidatus Glassbacteria bacterium]
MSLTRDELEKILESVECGIFTVDTGCRVTFWNRAAERITGRAGSGIAGRRLSEALGSDCPGGLEMDEDGHCELFERGQAAGREFRVLRPDGTEARVLINARALYDSRGRPAGAVGTLTDISGLGAPAIPAQVPGAAQQETATVPGMIGTSEPMRQVYRLIRFAADSESTVLVTGESGTGKEVAAKAIHSLSRRSGGPFVAVNCSALPESLLESELFGHVRGAFTGAVGDKVGRFELARHGTVFLDEIGDISPLIQLKLLRVLQDREYQRVGESKSQKADVRVIAATNRDLFQLVRRGEFREDLFFRLKVFPIALPPLRERKTDIPALLDYFLGAFNRRTGKKVERIHPEAMKLLLDYCWIGNVRELEHAVEYAFVLCRSPEIGPFELPQEILRAELRSRFCPPGGEREASGDIQAAGGRPLDSRGPEGFQREQLLRALEQTGWNRTAAAGLLGVSRVTVWNRMKKLGIAPPGKVKE